MSLAEFLGNIGARTPIIPLIDSKRVVSHGFLSKEPIMAKRTSLGLILSQLLQLEFLPVNSPDDDDDIGQLTP